MQPVWITPESGFASVKAPSTHDYHPVVLLTASNRFSERTLNISGYVQGAADDSEGWAHGLTPNTFWANLAALIRASEDELPSLIVGLVAANGNAMKVRQPTVILPSKNIWVANNAAAETQPREYDVVVSCSATASTVLAAALKHRYLHLACGTGKNGSRQLRAQLPTLKALPSMVSPDSRILIACETGKDLAVGVALAILCSLVDSNGMTRLPDAHTVAEPINKTLIKHRLSWIMVSMPDASPSRATLQSVNAYLMG